MSDPADSVFVRLPRPVVAELAALVAEVAARMHELLERNSDGLLNATEQAELETLVRISQLGEILAMTVRMPPPTC